MPKTKKPKKPYPDFPLFPHATGQWAKKIRGKMFYFGTDAEAALKKYTAERDDLQAGRTPRATPVGGVSIRDLCNRFLTAKKRLLESGELVPRRGATTTTLAKPSLKRSARNVSSWIWSATTSNGSAFRSLKDVARLRWATKCAASGRF